MISPLQMYLFSFATALFVVAAASAGFFRFAMTWRTAREVVVDEETAAGVVLETAGGVVRLEEDG